MAQDSGSFIWYELMTPDADGAKAFYDAVVGWRIDAAPSGDSDMDYRMIVRADGGLNGGVLALSGEMIGHGAAPGWYGYVHVPDVDAAIARFRHAGGAVLMAPVDMAGVGRMALLADPQGAPLYVMTPTPPPGDPEATSDVFSYDDPPQHVCWNELATTDPDAAIAFYTDLLGWRQEGAMPMGEMGDYKFLHHGGGMIGAVMPAPAAMPRSAWLYYIGVDDIDRALDAVARGGGGVTNGPSEIPGGGFAATCLDPQGVRFGLSGPRKGR